MCRQVLIGILLKYCFIIIPVFVFILLSVIPVYAAGDYLFPSDIIDQSEQSQYDIGRVSRYAKQREWVFPQISQATEKKQFYSAAEQYIPVDEQSGYGIYQAQQYRPQAGDSYGYEKYKYDAQDHQTQYPPKQPFFSHSKEGLTDRFAHFNNNNFKKYQPQAIVQPRYYQSDSRQQSRQFSGDYPNPKQGYPGQNDTEQYNSTRFSEQNLNLDLRDDYTQQRQYKGSYPHLLYPSDMEKNQRLSQAKSYNPNSFSPYNSLPYNDDAKNVKYVPVPVYSVPGTLPGTVPGVVTPGHMVPGYSHLSPDYAYGSDLVNHQLSNQNSLNQRGLNRQLLNGKGFNKKAISPFMGTQYNPMSGMGLFPGGSNPFDSFYKSFDNQTHSTSPFAAPGSMLPGFSIPNMFSSQ